MYETEVLLPFLIGTEHKRGNTEQNNLFSISAKFLTSMFLDFVLCINVLRVLTRTNPERCSCREKLLNQPQSFFTFSTFLQFFHFFNFSSVF